MGFENSWKQINDALSYIYSNYGSRIIDDPRKIRSLLVDLVPQCKREIKSLVNILTERELINLIMSDNEVSDSYVVSTLISDNGLSKEWANNIAVALYILCGRQINSTHIDVNVQNETLGDKPLLEGSEDELRTDNLRDGKMFEFPVYDTDSVGKLARNISEAGICPHDRIYVPIEIECLDGGKLFFDLLDYIQVDEKKYIFVSQKVYNERNNIFYVFRMPQTAGDKIEYVHWGEESLKVYSIFFENHKNEYKFLDKNLLQCNNAHTPKFSAFYDQEMVSKLFSSVDTIPDVLSIPLTCDCVGEAVFFHLCYSQKKKVSRIIIPTSVRKIMDFAFDGVIIEDFIQIPDSVSSIGYGAIYLGKKGYIKCSENSLAYIYARRNGMRNSVDIEKKQSKGLCQYCGGTFKKKMFQGMICENCGKMKDY